MRVVLGSPVTLPDAAPRAFATTNTGGVKGTVVELNTYVGGTGGVNVPNAGQLAGANVRGPVPNRSSADLDNNDQMVVRRHAARTARSPSPTSRTGRYQLTCWDYDQDFIIDSFNVTVNDGEVSRRRARRAWSAGTPTSRAASSSTPTATASATPASPACRSSPLTFKERDNSLLDAGQNPPPDRQQRQLRGP